MTRMSEADYARLTGQAPKKREAKARTRKAGHLQSVFNQDLPPAAPNVIHSMKRFFARGDLNSILSELERVRAYLDEHPDEGSDALRVLAEVAKGAVSDLWAEWERTVSTLPDPDPARAKGKIGRAESKVKQTRKRQEQHGRAPGALAEDSRV